jgi:hypothetical protein
MRTLAGLGYDLGGLLLGVEERLDTLGCEGGRERQSMMRSGEGDGAVQF